MAAPKKSSKKAAAKPAAKSAQAPKPAEQESHAPLMANAAQSVAALLAARAKQPKAAEAATTESAEFKKLKEGFAKPPVTGSSPLAPAFKPNKPQQGHGFSRQVGHNQTFNNASRSGVPRRTSGG